jgi:hypothetical protein
MTIEDRDHWLELVMSRHPTGMHFKTAWIIARHLQRGETEALSLSRMEREGGETCRRSMQRAIRWLEREKLIEVGRSGGSFSAPRRYTLLYPPPANGRIAA